ncbi:EF-hand domain-containing protein [Stenotrophomonas sp. MMGLT7]|uniref:EF-hand domain-containing protein n=1 Tax=Stenotrophomonas sp. MMGLT7 TaxID=2901227 RepID=UPI001E601F27|nr:EF-hand domain-containing protein [Stenotrophomonas sp. MMGLT7]MCD7098086.1 EF-hand domain-containing protein [Stenotrophomonas sp. MMGLT7]
MKTGVLTGAILCALLSPLHLHAQTAANAPLVGGHGNNVQAFIAQHDGNADGRLTWAEFEAFRRQRFDATDSNGNGTVDENEYVQEFADRVRQQLEQERSAQVEQTKVRFAALDSDKNGTVSRAEFDAAGARTWEGGQRALAEKAAKDKTAKDKADKPGNAHDAAGAARSDRRPGLLAMPTSHSAEGFLALYDGNGDGKVDKAEYDRDRDAQFARSDRNRDGVLDQDEYLAEYEERLDRRIATLDQGEDKQAHVRFGVLDADKDGAMTFAEYQASGKRTFDMADRNHDGTVDEADAKLPPPPRPQPPAAARGKTN